MHYRGKNARTFRKLPLCMAMLGCLYGATAMAQTAPAQNQNKQSDTAKDAKDLDKVTVTGSLLKRLEYDTTSPVQVITADTSVEAGQVDTAEFLQKSSVAAGSTQLGGAFTSSIFEGGAGVQSVNLRGLGVSRTAVLLNGNRPGPAGTRGQVIAFDLNVIPSSIVQRIEIVKDGSSSIYGSDALAGAANIITRKNIDRSEISFSGRMPFEGGGEIYTLSGATGWNFGSGNVMLAAEYFRHEPLRIGDRDYFQCPQDRVTDTAGNRVDREDRSITRGTPLGGCSSGALYANTIIIGGTRYIPSPNGVTIGPFPGYRPRTNANFTATNPQAFYEDVLNFDFTKDVWVVPKLERASLYASSDFMLGGDINWTSELLFNRRNTKTHTLRQFFPTVRNPAGPGFALPVMPFPSDQEIEVDYLYFNTGLNGMLGFTDTWSWDLNASVSRASGDYSVLAIQASKSGDFFLTRNPAPVNYFDPGFLSGERMDELVSAVSKWHTGNTIYDQAVFRAITTGELFNMPAGPVGAAFGAEYRRFSIDDQPSDLEIAKDIWGQTTAGVTKGTDHVKELFTEMEFPILKGLPMFESLSANVSARWFDYDTAGSDSVWKMGLGWQVNPTVRLRATKGTSFRAPGLYELFLGNQSSFVQQLTLDPCITWGQSNNDFLRRNCAAAGIPADYPGNPVTGEVFQGGGAGFLKPETSRAFTTGFVLTPTWIPLSIAFDYFNYEVNNQISTLSAGAITRGCYGSEVYPNAFCGLIVRNPGTHPTDPHKIEEVYATYINVNKQRVRGYDLLTRFDKDYSFGKVEVEGQFTYMIEDFEQIFSSTAASGFLTSNRNGAIGRPKLVGNLRTALRRGDFTYTWFMDYVDKTKPIGLTESHTYFGRPDTLRDITADARLYHAVSVNYNQPNWSVLVGIRNLLDEAPDTISSSAAGRFGNVPSAVTQYDYYGRSLFTRFTYKF